MKIKFLISPLLAAYLLLTIFQGSVANAAQPEPSPNQPLKPVQVFDVAAGKVVKTIPNDSEFQQFAQTWLDSITGLAPQVTSDKSCSYVFRVPLSKAATIKVNEISVVSDDLFLFYCKDKPPILLVFDEKRRPYLFLFKADITPFLKKAGLTASPAS